jgi:hypothetical protein
LLLKRVLNHPKFKLWFFFGVSLFFHLALIFNWKYSSPKIEIQADPIVVKLIDIATVSLSNKEIEPQPSKAEDGIPVEEAAKQEQSSTNKSSGQPFLLPPSAHLRYATLVNDNPNQDANIVWQQDGSTYSLDVKFWILFVGEIFFKSSGKIDEYGISPDNYSEKVGKRNRAVEFNRTNQELFFTSNKTNAPLPLGVQDRFSVIFQLSALVTGNPDIDLEGVARKIPIADVNRVDDWVFISQGDVEIPDQQLEKPILTRHFLRSPRNENDRRKLEVWLARDLDWLPVKIKQTDPNGTIYEMNLVQRHEGDQ